MPGWLKIDASVARSSTNLPLKLSRTFSSSCARRERFRIDSLLAQEDGIRDVEVNAWVRSVRRQKRVTFVALGDGSTINPLQAVLTPEQSAGLTHGAAVRIRGEWVSSAGKKQSNELQASSIDKLGENDAESNPIQPKYQTAEHLRTVPHLRTRVPANSLLLHLRSKLTAAITNWFDEHGFVQCHTPIITSSDCEGAGEVFTVLSGEEASSKTALQPFFRTKKYLTVSAQLHLEALSQAVDKVWTLSPTFRAEKSDTPRHLSEFYMLEAELCFVQDSSSVMDIVENLLRDVTLRLRKSPIVEQLLHPAGSSAHATDMVDQQTIQSRWTGLAAASWSRISYKQAVQHLVDAQNSGRYTFTIAPSFNDGLAAEHERYIATSIGRGSPVFVTDYPTEQKPFYMLPSMDGTVACFDLLVPDLCELVGGSMREHRLEALQKAMTSKAVQGETLEWYKDLRRYGSVPHGGFGLGFDRLLCYLAGVSNVKDVVSFPRHHNRCDC